MKKALEFYVDDGMKLKTMCGTWVLSGEDVETVVMINGDIPADATGLYLPREKHDGGITWISGPLPDAVTSISDRIRERMQTENMSQRELAQACNVTETSISRYLAGDRVPKATLVVTMAKVLNTTPNYLLGYEGK